MGLNLHTHTTTIGLKQENKPIAFKQRSPIVPKKVLSEKTSSQKSNNPFDTLITVASLMTLLCAGSYTAKVIYLGRKGESPPPPLVEQVVEQPETASPSLYQSPLPSSVPVNTPSGETPEPFFQTTPTVSNPFHSTPVPTPFLTGVETSQINVGTTFADRIVAEAQRYVGMSVHELPPKMAANPDMNCTLFVNEVMKYALGFDPEENISPYVNLSNWALHNNGQKKDLENITPGSLVKIIFPGQNFYHVLFALTAPDAQGNFLTIEANAHNDGAVSSEQRNIHNNTEVIEYYIDFTDKSLEEWRTLASVDHR